MQVVCKEQEELRANNEQSFFPLSPTSELTSKGSAIKFYRCFQKGVPASKRVMQNSSGSGDLCLWWCNFTNHWEIQLTCTDFSGFYSVQFYLYSATHNSSGVKVFHIVR